MIEPALDPARGATRAVRRVAQALLGDAVTRLEQALQAARTRGGDEGKGGGCTGGEKVDAAVHESRKRLKEMRSLLRLYATTLRDGEGKLVRPRENEVYRQTARSLGAARDAAVMVGTFESLLKEAGEAEEAPGPEAGAEFERLLAKLRERHEKVRGEARTDALEAAAGTLGQGLARVRGWKVERDGLAAMKPGLRRIYQRGRVAMRAAAAGVHPEAWHDWRKRAKDLRYALELLRAPAPAIMGGFITAARALTDDLGDDNDAAVLAERLAQDRDLCDESTAAAVGVLAQRRRERLQQRAMATGALLYAEKPAAFVRRIGNYWRGARATARRD